MIDLEKRLHALEKAAAQAPQDRITTIEIYACDYAQPAETLLETWDLDPETGQFEITYHQQRTNDGE